MTVADLDPVPSPRDPRRGREWRGLQSLPPCAQLEARYTLQEGVGHGSYATVWRAVHNASQRDCAVKCFQVERLTKKHAMDVHHEVALLQRLRHPNIVDLYGAYYSDDRICLVLEHLRGGDLKSLLMRPFAFDEATAVALLSGVLEALQYLHDRSIVHCDVKPENILFKHILPQNPEVLYEAPELLSQVKLVDFGFARIVGSQDDQKQCHGTPYYMAPEVVRCGYHHGGQLYGRAVDLWSLGVVGFLMLTQTTPFDGKTCKELFASITDGFWDFPADCVVSEEAVDFFRQLLVDDPKKRLTAAQALQHPWIQGTALPSSVCDDTADGSSDTGVGDVPSLEEELVSPTLHLRRTGQHLAVCTADSLVRWPSDANRGRLPGRRPTKKLVLSRADVTSGVESLLELLARHPSVTHIDLSQEPWTPSVGRHVLRILHETPSIRWVDVPGGQTYSPSRFRTVETLLCTASSHKGSDLNLMGTSFGAISPRQA